MYVAMSFEKLIMSAYWGIYIILCFFSGWFASGVIENFMSGKTSFSQTQESSLKRPVITISFQKPESVDQSS